jgi:hypothetical protein
MHEATVSRPAWEKVYLAVGDDAKQCELSLQWALSFIPPQMSLVLLHINRPVTVIPYGKKLTVYSNLVSDGICVCP